MQCKKCSRHAKIGGAAMTDWNCLICNEKYGSGSTCHPKICNKCSKHHKLCSWCLEKLND